ncbi:MAG: VWA domain-containing protein [Crocinitomicaceae bacterium]
MKQLIVIIFLVLGFQSIGQIKPTKQRHNFGELYKDSQSYVDIEFTNTSDKPQFLLTVDKPRDVYYIYSSKKVMPDSSLTIRFKINNNIKGRFTYNVDVYFSNPRAAIPIQLTGNVKQAEMSSSLTACPDFNNAPSAYIANTFDVTILVIDSLTREPIKNSKVYIVENGEMVGTAMTNYKGVVVKKIPYGYYYITAQKSPYTSNYHEGYLNFKRNFVQIELQQPYIERDPNPPVVVNEDPIDPPEEYVIDPNPVEDPEIVEEVVEVPEVVEEVPETPEVVETPKPETEPIPLSEVPDTVFNENYFKYNNITFILDVSTSMNGMGKMGLLKMSMIELTKILRANDMISMIKYSSEVETILANTTGDQKEQIIEVVKELKTSGMTAGGNAIKMAYKLNKKSFIPDGNNQVIMITDGVFNKGDKDYLRTIQQNYKSKGVKFSVVGIKTSDYVTRHMKDIVEEGGGDFIRILDIEDAQTKLIDEIKKNSFKFTEEKEQD